MIDKLISSYRAKIYDWNIQQWLTFLKETKMLVILYLPLSLAPIGLYIWGASKQSAIIMLLSVLAEGIPLVLIDRYTVKNHVQFLQNKQKRLKETRNFLKDTIPGVNLYQKETIDELINRLSERIEQKVPFKNFLKATGDFAKAIILPVVTYITGVYSSGLENMTIDEVAAYALNIVLLFGIARLAWAGFSSVAQTFICQDYNAAVAFKEDLLDLGLLNFRTGNDASMSIDIKH